MEKIRKTLEQRKQQANEIHNSFYDYSLWPETITARTMVRIICPLHGEFTQELSEHINKKYGCKGCAKNKRKQTNLKKYGVEYLLSSIIFQNKKKQTNLKKYGVEHATQSLSIQQKIEQTNLKKYGTKNPRQNVTIAEKIEQTSLKKYGTRYPFQNIDIKQKKYQTWFKKYGVEHPHQSNEIKNNKKLNSFKKYGVEHPNKKNFSKDTLEKLKNKTWLVEQHHFQKKTLTTIASELNVSLTVISRCFKAHNIETKHFFRSVGECEVNEFINNTLNIPTVINSRSVIPPYELDMFLPSHLIAVEYNGTFWHGDDFPEHQKRDKQKFIMCQEKSIQLITIWENDWKINKNELQQNLKNIIGKNTHV